MVFLISNQCVVKRVNQYSFRHLMPIDKEMAEGTVPKILHKS